MIKKIIILTWITLLWGCSLFSEIKLLEAKPLSVTLKQTPNGHIIWKLLFPYRQYWSVHEIERLKIEDPINTIYLNDPKRAEEKNLLPILQKPKDLKTFTCFWICASPIQGQPGQDKNYVFTEPEVNTTQIYLAIPKKEVPNYQVIHIYWVQAFDGILGYSPGIFVLTPFTFPVDKETFYLFKPQKQQSTSFINDGKRYKNFIARDKDRLYMAPNDLVGIARLIPAPDFRILNKDEEKYYTTEDESLELKKVEKLPTWDQLTVFSESLFWNNEYIGLEQFFFYDEEGEYRSIKVDIETFQQKAIISQDSTIWDFFLLEDKDAYYQFLYHEDGAYTEIKKIKKIK